MKKTLMIGLLAAIVACNPPTPPAQNNAPSASFTALATVQAGTALSFTSNSSDPDGDPLTLSWDFGDGLRGGGLSIAHVYSQAGAYTVKLTVSDGKSGVSSAEKAVTVSASVLVAGAALNVTGTITDATGTALGGVTVQLNGASLGSSDALGQVTVSVPTGVPINLVLTKTGFAHGFAALEFPLGSNASNADFKATLAARGAAQSLDASAGGAITGADNARVELPANALETLQGTPVTGAVSVSLTPVDVNDPTEKNAFPGRFVGIQPSGSSTGIVSLGTTEFALEQNGQRLNLKLGSIAKVRLPMYADTNLDGSPIKLGDTVPLWSLNEQSGDWVQEGTGVVVDSGAGTKALEAVVTHFSWWNADIGFTPSNPKPKCINDVPGQYDSIFEQATFCKFLAELDNPIPAQGSSVRVQAAAPRLPAFAATTNLAMAGSQALPVPAGVNIRYTGCIAGGAFCGSVVKNFAAGISEPFEIRLKRTDLEQINLPFDATRNTATALRLQFEGATNPNGVTVSIERSASSNFSGTVTLFDPQSAEVQRKTLGADPVTFEQQLFSTGQHLLEIRPTAGSSGSVRIRVARQAISVAGVWTTLFQSVDRLEDQPGVVVNASGNGAAHWVQSDGGAPALYTLSSSAFATSTATWGAVQLLESVSNHRPQVALGVSESNVQMMIWTQAAAVRWSRWTAGGTWSSPATIETIRSGTSATRPQIRLDANGNAVALWLEFGGSSNGNRLRMARFTADTGVWALETIAAGNFADTPVLTMDAAGNVAVLYFDYSPSSGYYVKRNVAGVWSAATKLFTASSAPNGFAAGQLELATGGNGMALYNDAGTVRVRGYDLAADTWQAEQTFAGTQASVGVDSSGRATMVYLEALSSPALLARRYDPRALTWSAPVTISDSSNSGVNSAGLKPAFNTAGDALTLFVKGQETLVSARAAGASAWTPPVLDGAFETRRVALDNTGRAIVLRIGYNASQFKYEVQAKRLTIR